MPRFEVDIEVTRIEVGTLTVEAEDAEQAMTRAEKEAREVYGSVGGVFHRAEVYFGATAAEKL